MRIEKLYLQHIKFKEKSNYVLFVHYVCVMYTVCDMLLS